MRAVPSGPPKPYVDLENARPRALTSESQNTLKMLPLGTSVLATTLSRPTS